MVLEAHLIDQIHEAGVDSSTQLLVATPLIVVDLPTEEWMRQSQLSESPLMIRSEADQQIGHELMKAMSNFKQIVAPHQPPLTLSTTSSKKKALVVDNQ